MRSTPNFERFNDSQRHALDARRNVAARAGAGSGKTSVLVERIVQLLAGSLDRGEPLELGAIVAITFTRKAAAELCDRLGRAFEQMSAAQPQERDFWQARAAELPGAAIGTIDSFCSRIVREFGWQGGVGADADFDFLEEYDRRVLQAEAIDRVINDLSASPSNAAERARSEACQWWGTTQGYAALAGHLARLLNHAVEPAAIIAAHRDLPPAGERVDQAWASLPAVALLRRERTQLVETVRALIKQIDGIGRLNTSLTELRERLARVLAALDDSQESDALDHLREALLTEAGGPRVRGLNPVKDDIGPLQETWGPLLSFTFDTEGERCAAEAADRLVLLLEPVYAHYQELCREANRFDFLTVARRTRDLLQSEPAVRATLKERYRYVHVDEFQDTNQLQWEIISWIVGDGPAGLLDADRLFIVGDPQQSIYRFRHADVSVFQRVQDIIHRSNAHHGHADRTTQYDDMGPGQLSTPEQRLGVMPLAENYRSLHPLPLLLMNRVFQFVFDPQQHELDPRENKFEVEHQELRAGRPPGADGELRYIVPQAPDKDEADDNDEEPSAGEDLGLLPVRAVVDQLVALYGQPKHTDPASTTLTWRDMAILLPSRTIVLTKLENELRDRGVPFLVTKGIGFWQRQEVRDVVGLATWLADPSDELSLFAVLRGPLGQLSDTEIFFLSEFGQGSLGRGFRLLKVVDDPSADRWQRFEEPARIALQETWQGLAAEARERVRQTAARLAAWLALVDRMPHLRLLQRALEESGAYAIYAADRGSEQVLANLERLEDAIRREEARSAPPLARLARWLRSQVDDSPREEQAAVAPGQDAVQVMTIHAAKGLEFPVVAVLKMERPADYAGHPRLLVKTPWDELLPDDRAALAPAPGTVAVNIRHPQRPRERYVPRLLQALKKLDRAQQLAEGRRLFYVAATRAKERLILVGKEGCRSRLCWQRWLEDALAMTDVHRQAGLWEDPTHGFRVPIIVQAEGPPAPAPPPEPPPSAELHLDALTEAPRRVVIAADELGAMLQVWRRDRRAWWQRYRANPRPFVEPPTCADRLRAGGAAREVRHLLETPGDMDVDYVLDLGVWRMVGRIDKLRRTDRGFEIIAWVVEGGEDGLRIHLQTAALALCRSGRPAETISGRLVLVQDRRTEHLQFVPAELERFGANLQTELAELADYTPDDC